jgi:hypothetical protein
MKPIVDPGSPEWLSGRAASMKIGCSPTALQRAALLGQIRTRLDPGVPPRYHAGDVEKIAQSRPQTARA